LPELDVEAFLVTRLPNVRYLTGFSGTNGQAVLTAEEGVFLTDGRYAEQARHEVLGLRRGAYSGDFVNAFAEACRDLGVRRVAFETSGVSYRLHSELSATGIDLVPVDDEVERLRWAKDAGEIGLLNVAQSIADHAFEAILDKLAEGVTERGMAFELDTLLRREAADGLAFDTIMAFGESAAEPHHHPTDRPLSRGDVVKMDFGCVVGGYHSDMTRTVAFGEVPGQLQEVYAVVQKAQQAGVDAVRAGVTGESVDLATRQLISDAGYGEQYKHSLGHGVGLEIHEPPWLRAGSDQVLPPGAVVTVEPGIYLDSVGGVRIEDMVEVTPGGCRVIPSSSKELMVLR
jgi:Xaa-Pro aminopeptidase